MQDALHPASIRKMTDSNHVDSSSHRLDELAKSFALKNLPESEVELEGEIPFADIEPLQEKALKHFAEEIEMPGFRKGHVPLEMVKKRVGDIALLEEAVELFMRDFYTMLVLAKDVDAIGRPEIRITKLAPGNPVGIVIKTAVYPEISLPKDWKKLYETIPDDDVPTVEDREIDDALLSIRRAKAKEITKTAAEEVGSSAAGDASSDRALAADHDGDAAESTSSAANQAPAQAAAESASAVSTSSPATEEADSAAAPHPVTSIPDENTLPILDDAFAQSLGAFSDLADLKAKMRENLVQEKAQKVKDARRGKIIEALLEKVQLSVPAVFVDSELEKIVAQMQDDVTRYGMTFEDYLKRINKTQEEVRAELRDQAGKRAKLQLVLNKIAADEKVESIKEEVDNEMKHALEHFPEARPDLLRIHIETVMRNEKTLQILEGSVDDKKDPHEGHDHSDPNHTH